MTRKRKGDINFPDLKRWEQVDVMLGHAKRNLEDIRKALRKHRDPNWYLYGDKLVAVRSYIEEAEAILKTGRRRSG